MIFKNLLRIVKSYKFHLIAIIYFEFLYLMKGYKGNKFNFRKDELMADDIPDEIFKNRDPSKAIPPLYGALIKNEQDVQLLERLAFMARREGNTNQQ